MDLATCFHKAARRIEVLSHRIVFHRLDHCKRHTLSAEVVQCVFNQQATDTPSANGLFDREIRNAALADCIVDARANVSQNRFQFDGNEYTRWIGLDILVDMSGFAPTR